MKTRKYILGILFALCSIAISAQLPSGASGNYKYVRSFDNNGRAVDKVGFERVSFSAFSLPNMFGPPSNYITSTYWYFTGWQSDGNYNYAGYQNGWFVYTKPSYGMNYGYYYYLISQDLKTVRKTDANNLSITHEYTRCAANEKMNNAPTR